MVDLDGGRFVDVAFVIRERLDELGLEQRDLARAARVTESYVSQLLTRKKAPPAPNRTDIYDRMDRFLKLPDGELARVAELARKQELKRQLGDTPEPLFPRVRDLILRKCSSAKAKQILAIFERQPFGELERLVAKQLLEVASLATDIFHLSARHLAVLDSLIDSWDIDLATFSLEIVLHRRPEAERVKRFEFLEPRLPPGLPLHELEPLHSLSLRPSVQDDLEAEGREIDIPRVDQRIEDCEVPG